MSGAVPLDDGAAIYVKRRVSVKGEVAPRWSGDGRELFFIGPDDTLMAATVRATDGFDAGAPRALFTTAMRRLETTASMEADWLAVDRQRFFIVPPPGPLQPAPPITVVVDWRALLRTGAP